MGNAALNFMFGRWGYGLVVAYANYAFCLSGQLACSERDRTEYIAGTAELNVGRSFLAGELVLAGLLSRARSIFDLPSGASARELRLGGLQVGAGMLWRPADTRYRVGVTARTAAELGSEATPPTGLTYVLPRRAHMPWQLAVGISYLLDVAGSIGVSFGDSEHYAQRWPWGNWRLAADLLLEGPSERAVSIVSWAGQVNRRAGMHATMGARLGLEGELWDDLLRGRIGSYFEASRAPDVRGRVHGTAGLDLHLGHLVWDWRLGGAVDLASRYVNTAVSFGFWH